MILRPRAVPVFLGIIGVLLFGVEPGVAGNFDGIRERIQRAVTGGEVPSIAVAVARKGETVWEEAFGWADREARRPATIHTPYSVASVTKPFTATALMVLAEEGEVALDRPVNDYLERSGLRAEVGNVEEATIRRIAGHTAGLPLHHRFYVLGDERRRTPDEMIRRHGVLVWPPGERFRYSNLGYGVLERVVEEVSGRDLGSFLEARVFAPLGLEHTDLRAGTRETLDGAARYGGDGRKLPLYDTDHRGGSSVWSCVHDLLRFGLFHVGSLRTDREAVLSRDSRREMQRPGTPRPDPGRGYGIGWSVDDRRRRPVVFHTGGMPGATASLALVPAAGVVVAVVANARSELPLEVSREILERVAPVFPRDRFLRSGDRRVRSEEPFRSRVPRRFRGVWRGSARRPTGGEDPLVLEITGKTVRIESGGRGGTFTAHVPRFRSRALRALVRGPVEGSSGRIGTYVLELGHRRGRLAGALVEVSSGARGFPRALSRSVELVRVAPPVPP